MKEAVVIGSIMVRTDTVVSWTRVTAEEGWVEALLRTLPYASKRHCCVGLLTFDERGFKTALHFDAVAPVIEAAAPLIVD